MWGKYKNENILRQSILKVIFTVISVLFILTNNYGQKKNLIIFSGNIEPQRGTRPKIEIYEGQNLHQRMMVTDNSFHIELEPEKDYVIFFSKPGFITQKCRLSGNVPESENTIEHQIINHVGFFRSSAYYAHGDTFELGCYEYITRGDTSFFDLVIEEENMQTDDTVVSVEKSIYDLLTDNILAEYDKDQEKTDEHQNEQKPEQQKQYQDLQEKLKQDSVELYEKTLKLKQELVKNAKTRLELDRLNAKTKRDSQLIQERERIIETAKEQIEMAKQKIQLANYRMRMQKLIIFGSIIGLIIVIGLLLYLYFIYKSKNRLAQILENKNIELEENRQELQTSNERLTEQNEMINRQKEEIELQNRQITSSIYYAKRIQDAIFPKRDRINTFFPDSFVIYSPKDIVSGDFIWIEEFSGKVFFSVVDCTGHGVPGAFMSIVGDRLLNEILFERKITQPVDMMVYLNEKLKSTLNQDETDTNDGMDLSLCSIENLDNNKQRIIFSGAKRPLVYFDSQKNLLKVMRGDRKPVGGMYHDEIYFTQKELILEKGDVIYLYTDGITDQISPQGKKLGTRKFIKLLQQHAHLSLMQQKEQIISALNNHQQRVEQMDDITLVGIKL
jgi:serine phosphatase RsbU (regulator of sigma subunit)